MKLQELIDELETKECYTNFKSEHPESHFCAGFFILNLEESTEQIQLDYYIKSSNQIASFEFPFENFKLHNEIISAKNNTTEGDEIKPLPNQTTKIKIDIDDLKSTVKETIERNEGKIVPTKIIAILKEDSWNLTCMDNVLGMVRIKLNAITGEVENYSKGSLMDFMGIKKK